jgi:nitroreductase
MERIADFPIEPRLLERWSPRAMDGSALTHDELMSLFEAARWAPSCANQQPWRFIYALAGTPHFDKFFDLLAPGNKPWCAMAGALVMVVSKKTFDGVKPIPTPSYDAGAAWMSLALQASAMGLVCHGMAGFDYARAPAAANVPDDYKVEAMFAVGHPGKLEDLPEALQARESKSGRRPVGESAFEGSFPG